MVPTCLSQVATKENIPWVLLFFVCLPYNCFTVNKKEKQHIKQAIRLHGPVRCDLKSKSI